MNLFPPPPPYSQIERTQIKQLTQDASSTKGWEAVIPRHGSAVPCPRSLHAGSVWMNNFIVFGGYDGRHRVNDLHSFNFSTNTWQRLNNAEAPSPRDRHVALVFENSLYIFGGFDGLTRINDLHEYNLETNEWSPVVISGGSHPPSPRHSHAAVIYRTSMFVFGGYDGLYRNDFHEFNFVTRTWSQVHSCGETPRARYRGTCVVSGDNMILHGGHDGNRHLQDTHIFDFNTSTWSLLLTEGPVPASRDSHVSVIHGRSMYLYGGSTGAAMGDFHELKLEFKSVWSPVTAAVGAGAPGVGSSSARLTARSTDFAPYSPAQQSTGSAKSTPTRLSSQSSYQRTSFSADSSAFSPAGASRLSRAGADNTIAADVSPGARFCHVGVLYGSSFYIFGGYDGTNRLNDFLRYDFAKNAQQPFIKTAPSTLISDLRGYVDNDLLSDITFVVEGRRIHAHKILCLRCPYFHSLLTGEYMESRAEAVSIQDVQHSTFLLLLEYLYTDEVRIDEDTAMDLFQVADRFGVDRLKSLCEHEMLSAVDIESAARILLSADERNAENLREHCMQFILTHFDEISKTVGFEEMGHNNIALVFEILKRR